MIVTLKIVVADNPIGKGSFLFGEIKLNGLVNHWEQLVKKQRWEKYQVKIVSYTLVRFMLKNHLFLNKKITDMTQNNGCWTKDSA